MSRWVGEWEGQVGKMTVVKAPLGQVVVFSFYSWSPSFCRHISSQACWTGSVYYGCLGDGVADKGRGGHFLCSVG